jgi:hypothetical protein
MQFRALGPVVKHVIESAAEGKRHRAERLCLTSLAIAFKGSTFNRKFQQTIGFVRVENPSNFSG